MLTWPQNAGNPFSQDLNFKNFTGEMPPDPSTGKEIDGVYLEPPSVKSCIHPRGGQSFSSPASILMKFFLNTGSIHIVLHEDSSAEDHLQSCFQACTLDYVIRTRPNSTKVITGNCLIHIIQTTL